MKHRMPLLRPSELFTSGNDVTVHAAGEAVLARMLECVQAASSRVFVEIYWLARDALGQRALDALEAAARRGVEVRLIYDSLGSYDLVDSDLNDLRAAGAQVEEFNPVNPFAERFHLQHLTLRDHRKLLCVDGRVAFIGGANLTMHWLERSAGGQGWRDEIVELRGPVVCALEEAFGENWQFSTGEKLPPQAPSLTPVGDTQVSVLTQGGFPHRRRAYHAYLRRVWAAKSRIYLAHAYFVPEGRLLRGLLQATRRGVDVRILCPAQSDVTIVDMASRHVWERLLRAGVRIFEWNESVLHSKIAVIDADWVTAGSLNLDAQSLRSNRELNVGILSAKVASVVVSRFMDGCGAAREVSVRELTMRPFFLRWLHALSYRIRSWL